MHIPPWLWFRPNIEELQRRTPDNVVERGFRTLVLNRARRGGILASGASLHRNGESGKGVASRWYPDTLARRLTAIEQHAARIDFRQADGLDLLIELLPSIASANVAVFADPPYTAGGKEAGRRLYQH